MLIFFDFDDTLFDRNKFLLSLAKKMGLSYEDFLHSYNKNFKSKKKNYSLKQHLKILNLETKTEKLDLFLSDLTRFVLPGAVSCLKKARSKASQVILLSQGDKEFQAQKIKASGLIKYFDTIIITSDKVKALKPWQDKDSLLVVVNDKQEENIEIKKTFPRIKIIRPNI